MNNSNGNNSDRLDRIERILEATAQRQQETENIVQSNSRLLQAMLEQRATDRLEHEERMKRLEDTVIRLDDTVARLTRIEEAQNRMLASMDDDKPNGIAPLTALLCYAD
ncbi:MAG: phage tail protein [Waterburya sp.]